MELAHAYVLILDGDTAAYTTMVVNGKPQYAHLQGKWLSQQEYIGMHRLAVSPAHRGKGLCKRLFQKVEQTARAQGIHSIKLDTNFDNQEMLHILLLLGYTYCGEIDYGERGKRLAFEKRV